MKKQYKLLFLARRFESIDPYEWNEPTAATQRELDMYSREGWIVKEMSFGYKGHPAFVLLEADLEEGDADKS